MFCFGMFIGILTLEQVYLFGWGWLFQTMAATMLVIIGTTLGIAALTLNSLVVIMRHSQSRP